MQLLDSIAKDCPCESNADQHRAKLTEVKWAKPAIHPLYYPMTDDQKIALSVKTENVSDGVNGSRIHLALYGYYEPAPSGEDKRQPVELPITLLGIDHDEDEVQSNDSKASRPETAPPSKCTPLNRSHRRRRLQSLPRRIRHLPRRSHHR